MVVFLPALTIVDLEGYDMKRQALTLHSAENNEFRAVIKTTHGRLIFLSLFKNKNVYSVKYCYYIDRVRSGEYYAAPQKLTTRIFTDNEILSVVSTQLDRYYFGLEFSDGFEDLSEAEFITMQLKAMQTKYNFLIMVGEGELIDGIPSIIRTRFKNRIHRSIYLEMQYHNGKGIITDCHYYDRKYKECSKVIPEMLYTIFFEYNRQTILNTINNELNTSFSHIIFITDGSLNIENKTALCGNL